MAFQPLVLMVFIVRWEVKRRTAGRPLSPPTANARHVFYALTRGGPARTPAIAGTQACWF
ncbi:hypothetical protein [Streptomyces collinus]|uniref:hypothetical protein n=1 Tax=Streptomyces collinus TaxID=42684 RepID=UPI0033EE2752